MIKRIFILTAEIILLVAVILQLVQIPQSPVGATIPIVVANFETSLQSSISSSATSMTLVSGTDTAGNSLSGYLCFTIDEGASGEEHVCGTASGTAITSMIRGIDPIDGALEVTSLQNAHRRGASIKLTNFPILGILARILNGTDTIPNLLQYATTTGNPTDDDHLARKAYVDLQATGTSTVNRIIVTGTAGETVAKGEIVYFNATDNEWRLTDASNASTSDNLALGIARGVGTNGNTITDGVLLFGEDTNQSSMTQGDTMFLSDTAGAISSSAGTVEVVVGIARTTTDLYFMPRFDKILTKDQADAIAGNAGTPSSTNLFVTQQGLQEGAELYAASSAGSDTYAITLSPAITAYTTGMIVRFEADVANTGAATLNINSVGAKSITKNGTTTLANNDILAGQFVELIYDGTQFQMKSQLGNLSGVPLDVQTFTSNGTWTKPANAVSVLIEVQASGGGGQGGSNNKGGGGGGGGGRFVRRIAASELGATESVVVGAAGAGGAAGAVGGAGNVSSFAGKFQAVGGGGAGSTTSGTGGASITGYAAASPGISGQGTTGVGNGIAGVLADRGGASGGGFRNGGTTGTSGGSSAHAAGGGGGASFREVRDGGPGGNTGTYVVGGGGAGGSQSGGAGAAGGYLQGGGGGAGEATGNTGGAGGAGGTGGGGGGGGGFDTTGTGGVGGAGGAGEVIITTTF